MKKLILIILLASSVYSQDPWDWFAPNNTVLAVTPVFAGFDTTGFMHSPYPKVWTVFNGLTRGAFNRLINHDSVTYGINLISATTDSCEIGVWVKIALPVKNAGFIMNKFSGNGWTLHYGNSAGSTLEFTMTSAGVWSGFPLMQITDSLPRFIKIRINNLGGSGSRLRFWANDTLRIDSTNSSAVLAVLGNTSALTFGVFGSQNNISDTTQQSTNTTLYFKGQIRDPYIRKWRSGTDTLYGPWKSFGSGQILYDSSRVNTWLWDRGNWAGSSPQQNFNVGLGLFGETPLEVNATRLKDPVLWRESGSPVTCVQALGSGVAWFGDSTYRESYTNMSGIKIKGTDTFYVLGGRHNVINFASGSNGKTYATNIAKFNVGTSTWSAWNESTPPLNNIIGFVDYNDSISYQCGIDSVRGVTGTKGISQYNWNTNTYSTVYGLSLNDGGQGYRLYKSGNAVLFGGDWTTLNGTTGWGDIAIQRGYGNAWSKLGTGSSGSVWAFNIQGTDTLVGGIFNTANSVTVYSIAKWNGTTFTAMGTGIKDSAGNAGIVWDIEYFKGSFYALGQFQVAGGVGCLNIAKWTGSAWVNVGNIYRTNPLFRGSVIEGAVSPNGELMCLVGAFNKISWNGKVITSYNNVMFNGTDFFAMPPIDQRAEGVVWLNNYSVLIDGDETAYGGYDIYNGGSNACHRVNFTY